MKMLSLVFACVITGCTTNTKTLSMSELFPGQSAQYEQGFLDGVQAPCFNEKPRSNNQDYIRGWKYAQ
jgi:hypothetical protein